jgi:hypothetical protein
MPNYIEEANSHYAKTIGVYAPHFQKEYDRFQGDVIQVDSVHYDPELSGISTNDLHLNMSYEDACKLMYVRYQLHGQQQEQGVLLRDILFPFPESKLINTTDNGRAKAVFINRYSYRQWRRGLRQGMLVKFFPNQWLMRQVDMIINGALSWKELEEFFNPSYYSPVTVCDLVRKRPGTYAISPEFWVGLGRSGIIFGYHQYTVGKLVDDDVYELHPNAQDLFELLMETVGGERASIRGHRVPEGALAL